uniref:glycosyltransferase n=1 Tax=Alistipes sp. D31t1_170403_E11 TaxID=2787128 RepID=UPI0018970625|nr:glycosyltransferase [Alistipes sp. D31t1_170403_E11]
MELKTIAFYNWVYPGGGGETVTRNLGHFFRSKGFRIVIYAGTLFEDILTEEDRRDFTRITVPLKAQGNKQIDYDAFCQSLNSEQVDCLIVQGMVHTDFARIRRDVGCKIIFCIHSIPLWEVRAARSKRCSDLPKPTLLKKLEFLLFRQPTNLLTNKLKHRVLKSYTEVLPHLDRLVMLCPEYKEEMQLQIRKSGYPGSKAPDEKFMSISNPLLPPLFPVDRETPKEKTVLYVGRLKREDKRVDRLLTIWQKIERSIPEWRLQILGRGEEMETLRKQAARLGLKRIEFMGHQTDVVPYYRRASFICLTSNFEGLPMCLIEAQQYGVIPVAFDSFAAIRGITENGKAGIMVPAFNKRKYAARLKAVLLDNDQQEQMRKHCYDAPSKYDIQVIGQQWLDLFSEL